jgi:hypothetical protein
MGVSKTYFEINPPFVEFYFIILKGNPNLSPNEEALFVPICNDIMELLQ